MVATMQNHHEEGNFEPPIFFRAKNPTNFREILKLTNHQALNNMKVNYKRPKNLKPTHRPKNSAKSKNSKKTKNLEFSKNTKKKNSKKRKRNIKNEKTKNIARKSKKVEKSRFHRIRCRHFEVARKQLSAVTSGCMIDTGSCSKQSNQTIRKSLSMNLI